MGSIGLHRGLLADEALTNPRCDGDWRNALLLCWHDKDAHPLGELVLLTPADDL